MAKKKTNWEDQFRAGITHSGKSLKEIAADSEIDDSQLSRFLRGERTITLPTAEKVAAVIGLELKAAKGRKQ